MNLSKYLVFLKALNWKKNVLFIFLAISLLAISTCTSNAQLIEKLDTPIVELTDKGKRYPLEGCFEILEDKTQTLQIEDVASSEMASHFVANKKTIPSFGYTSSIIWLKLKVNNKSQNPHKWLLEIAFPRINHIDLYWPNTLVNNNKAFNKKSSGSAIAFSQRELSHRNLVFPLELLPQTEQTFYIRIQSHSAISLPAIIWQEDALYKKDNKELFLLGIYYGVIMIMIVYNLFIYLGTFDKIYFYYGFRGLAIVLAQLTVDGLSAQYLWPNSSNFAMRSFPIGSGLVCIAACFLSKEYLALKINFPTFEKILKCLVVWFSFLVLGCLLIPIDGITFGVTLRNIASVINFTAFNFVILTFVMAVLTTRKGYRPAKFYLNTSLMLVIGGVITILRNAGMVTDNLFVAYGFHIFTVLGEVCLSFGLADRINILQGEKQAAENNLKLKEKDSEIFRLRNVELNDANLKLKELDQIKANFTAMLVHDLKSPLTVVRTTLGLLDSEETIKDPKIKKFIGVSEKNIDKILALVNELLEFYRSEFQEIKLSLQLLDVEQFLQTSAESTSLVAKTNNISVELHCESPLPKIFADVNKLERAFSNLLSNAIKFSVSGGSIKIEAKIIKGTGIEEGLSFLLISITDNGEGIPPEAIPYLFEPYQQAESKKKKVGVGLGLAIVKRIIAAHGGNISVRSQLGVGSCFSIILPTYSNITSTTMLNAKNEQVEDVSNDFSQTNQISQTSQTSQTNQDRDLELEEILKSEEKNAESSLVLLVDDDLINQKIVKSLLEKWDYKIDVVSNGTQALEAFNNKDYKLILMDCYMPEMNGYEATFNIRNLEKTKSNGLKLERVPIVALTALDAEETEKCFKAGMDDFLEKPFKPDKLKEIVKKWLPNKVV